MLPEFHMVLESAVNRGAKEVTLPIEIASDLKLHIEKLEEQLFQYENDAIAAAVGAATGLTRESALHLVAAMKVHFQLTGHEIGQVAATLAVKNGNS